MSAPIGDKLYETAHADHFNIEQRLGRLASLRDAATAYVQEGLTDPQSRPDALRTAGWLACYPTLTTIAQRQPHSRHEAGEVYENLQHLFGEILEYEGTNFAKPAARRQPEIEGCLAELGVFGLLQAGIVHRRRRNREGRFILPATSRQDRPGKRENGLKLGVDLVIHRGIFKELVQVKKSKAASTYRPGIAVLSPKRLLREESDLAALLLMDAVANDDQDTLMRAYSRAQSALSKAHTEGLEYFSIRHRGIFEKS